MHTRCVPMQLWAYTLLFPALLIAPVLQWSTGTPPCVPPVRCMVWRQRWSHCCLNVCAQPCRCAATKALLPGCCLNIASMGFPDRQTEVCVYVLLCPVCGTRARLPAANARQVLAGLLLYELACIGVPGPDWPAFPLFCLFGFCCWCKVTGVLVNHVHMCAALWRLMCADASSWL